MKDLSERINALTPEQRAVFELLRKSSRRKPARPGAPPLARRAGTEPAPLSFDQERLWFLQTLDPESVTYNNGTLTRMEGPLDVPALAAALGEVVRRHEAWRTVFAVMDGRPVQIVLPGLRPGLPVVDLREVPAERRQARALRLARERIHERFDLERGPLLRVLLLRLKEEEHLCLLTFHHIITDWISSQIFWREMAVLYEAAREGRPSPLPEPPVQYSDFAVWQREWLRGEVLQHHLDFWVRELEGVPQVLELPTDRPRPLKLGGGGGMVTVELPPPLAGPFRTLARQEGATPFLAALAAFSALLFLHSGQERFLVGSPNANRSQPELQGLLGFFLSQLVLPVDVSGDPSFRELLRRVKASAFAAYAHQELPFGKLVEALRPERDPSRAPLAQVSLQLVEEGGAAAIPVAGLTLSEIALGDVLPKLDLGVSLVDTPEGIRGWFEYPRNLWDHTSVQRMAGRFEILAEAAAAAPDVPLSALPVLSEAGLHQVLVEWNDTAAGGELPTVDRSFEEQAARSPGVVAVTGDGRSSYDVTYGELDRAANRLAHRLRSLGVGPETRVGLCLERGPGVLVGMLGVWKAGGAWVPLDPGYPKDRLAFLIEDAGVAVVVAEPPLLERLPEVRTVCWDGMGAFAGEPDGSPKGRRAAPEDLAYILYTSGTTGRPKGVMVEHGNFAAMLLASVEAFGWREGDRVPALAPFSFDVFLLETLGALVSGGTMELIPLAPALDLDRLVRSLRTATRLATVTSLMRQILALAASGAVRADRLRAVYVGGEAVAPDLIAGLRSAFPGLEVWICYGPTETAIQCTAFKVPPEGLAGGRAMLGRPLDRAGISVRRRDGGLAPVGVPGELWVTGAGVGRGYLGRPELTAERFVTRDGRRWYRTGDLARWLPDGNLEFTGRMDDQVKIRGFRVEPGEIEARLNEHPAVREAAVLVREAGGTKHLAAYVVPAGASGDGFLDGLRSWTAGRLPEHMVPSFFVSLPELPLTAHGKLDREALLAIEPAAPAGDRTAPRTPAEEALARIWRSVLGLEQVGVHDNFFHLGGDSILSIQVVARARSAGWAITPQQMFERQTIAALARVARPAGEAVEQEAVAGESPLTPIQRRFFAELAGVPEALHWFNQAVLLEVRGKLAPDLGARTLAALALHHDALRLRFASSRAVHAPAAEAAASFPLTVVDLSALPEDRLRPALEQAAGQVQTGLHLERGPLARAVLFERGAGRSGRLLLTIHHLVVDGVSWRILLEDLQTAYEQLAAGGAVRLPAKTTSWKRWAELLAEHARSAEVREELDGWLSLPEVPPLPVDRPGAGNGTVATRRAVTVSLSREVTAALLKEAPAAYRTQVNDLLVAALARAFSRWTGSDRLRIDLEGHGREEVAPGVDLSRTVGWFTTAVPVVVDLAGARDPGGAIRCVKERLRAIPRKGIGFGLLRWMGDDEAAERLAALPLAEVGFNYLGQLDAAFGAEGLFAPAGESPGLNQSPRTPRWTRIEVDARVLDDRLWVDWGYTVELHDEATIERLAAGFREELEALVAHCLSTGAGGFTPSDFPLAGLDQETIDRLFDRTVEDAYPLSPLQEGMLFHTLYSPESEIYFEQMTCTLAGPLDVPAFRRAWGAVVERQPVLRTSFAWEGLARPVQIVRRGVEVPVHVEDWRGRPEARLEGFAAADRARGFDLSRAPLMRLALLRTGDAEHRLVWSFHHSLMDGWCLSLVFREVLLFYDAFRTGAPAGPLEPVLPYRDYIAWLLRQDLGRAERSWREDLAGFTSPTPVPFDHPGRGAAQRAEGFGELQAVLPSHTVAGLETLQRQGLTLSTIVQGAWALLLSRWSGERDVVFGGVVSGRPPELPGIESAIGLFINTLPVRVGVDPMASAGTWLRALQERQVRQRELEWSPLSEIQRWSEVPAGEPLFHSLLVYENYPLDPTLGERLSGLEARDFAETELTNYPLTLVAALREAFVLRLSFDHRFEAATARRMLGHLETLLAGLTARPEGPLGELPLLSEAERHQLLREWSAWGGVPPVETEGACLHELFEAQAGRTPEALALVEGETSLTYAELNRRANRLAHALRDLGVGPEVRVALCVERSAEMIVALLGILKAGGAYVPLDPDTPAERLAFLLEDALCGVAAPLLVTQASLAGCLPETRARTLVLDDPSWRSSRSDDPASGAGAESLAYVIYTSGSTGLPKGVMVRHGSAVAYVRAMSAVYGIGPGDRAVQFASISFDASVEEIFTALSRGASLAVRTGVDEPAELLRRHERLQFLSLPTAYWHQLAAAVDCGGLELPAELRLVVIGGERALPERWAAWGKTGVRLVNSYGPTEATIAATVYEHPGPGAAAPEREVPIGRPLPGVAAHVLDRDLRPVPLGAAGELCLGGVCLARGYLGRPALTAERFVPDPFGGPGERLYRTGDLVRRLPDGSLEFAGRLDAQVKVRGFRVEPGEIEAALARHPAVREAAVLPWEAGGGELRLAAWVAAGEASADELRDFLLERLPAWMVPAAFVLLDALPRTPQGKLDRRALPDPGRAAGAEEGGWAAPRTPAEEALAAIWRDLLRVERVGVHDDFFRLGGDSILSIQVVARARQAGLALTPRQIFENPTVAALAALAAPATAGADEEGPVSGEAPLTPIQRELLEGDPVDPHHFNQALLLSTREPVEPGRLEAALAALVRHHDALRLRFPREGTEWRQVHAPLDEATAGFVHVDLSGLDEGAGRRALEAAAAALQGAFDLARGPLLRGALFTLESGARLLLAAHHLVVDGVSWRILLEDLETAYRGLALPAKTTSWKRWTERLAEHARSPEVREELEAWLALAGGETPPLPREAGAGGNVGALSVSLPEGVTAALLREAPDAYRARVDDLLLAALVRAFEAWTGQPLLRVDLEGHGREEIAPGLDLSRTVGWFTTVFPVILDLEGTSGPGDAIRRVKERLRRIPGRGIGYGLLRFLSGDREAAARLAALPAAEVGFNYLGQLDSSLGEGGRWTPAEESPGPARSPRAPLDHAVEVNAWVLGGRLQASWSYDASRFREETIAALAGGFAEALAGLVEHCLSPGAGGFTPSDFPLAGLDQAALDALLGADRSVEDLYPLTAIQEGMLFTELHSPAAGIYFEHMAGTLRGPLDAAAFRRAWQRVLDRHPALRTALLWRDVDRPLQAVRRGVELPWSEEDWCGETDPDGRLRRWLDDDRARGLDLSRAPLMRAALLRSGEREHRFVWSFHHVLFDGWCNGLILREVFAAYEAFREGREPELPPVRPFRDFIAWLGRRDPAASEAFWRAYLAGFDAPAPLPFDRPADPGPSAGHRDEEILTLPASTTAALGELARSRSLTLNTVLQGAWALLLSRWGGGLDVVFGAVVSGRPAELPGVESMIGLFINTLPVRVRIEPAVPLVGWLRALQEGQLDLRQHEHDPLPQVQRWSELPPGEPLFHSLLVYENYPLDREALAAASRTLTIEGFELAETTEYPLTAVIVPGRELRVRASYGRGLETATVRRMLRSLETLLEAAAAGADLPLAALPAVSRAELHQILLEPNEGASFPVSGRSLDRLFEAAAARSPEAAAVTFEGRHLTYGELNARANRLARRLRRLGVGPEVLVGLAVERSPEMVVGILGILKAGGAYVPLDPSYPEERLLFTLEDARIPVLLTQERLRSRLPAGEAHVLCLDAEGVLGGESPENLPGELPADRLAYAIYTSGTTGRPKGTLILHANVTWLFAATEGWFDFGPGDVWTLFHSFAFDISVWELWGALLYGGRVVVVPYWVSRSPGDFLRLLWEEGVTVLNQTPSAFRQLAAADREVGGAGDLRLRFVILAGEALDLGSLGPWFERHGDRSPRLINMYGITETTVYDTYRPVGREDLRHADRSPIGVPIPALRVYVLGPDGSPVPAGAPGEIHLSGAGLGRGYLGRPDLTAGKFVPDPYGGLFGEPGARAYRTGDLARFLPGGELQFLGRMDQQVKVRGFRVELGEVEAVLAAHPGVREAAVLPREDASGGQRLIAFAVPRRPGDPLDDLRPFLAGRLPDYMVPSEIRLLEALPLGPTGKLDRRALKALAPAPAAAAVFVPPRNPVEEGLAAIWSELLGVERVGVGDDFFALGGHSLLATQLATRVRRQLGVDLPLPRIFELRTLEELAREVLARTLEEAGGDGEVDALMADLDDLTDEEALALLEEEGP
jgi:amino acid adenylation domain-containing protein/non-ribosomal peptide synthase protein (TIGR01720 family)